MLSNDLVTLRLAAGWLVSCCAFILVTLAVKRTIVIAITVDTNPVIIVDENNDREDTLMNKDKIRLSEQISVPFLSLA